MKAIRYLSINLILEETIKKNDGAANDRQNLYGVMA